MKILNIGVKNVKTTYSKRLSRRKEVIKVKFITTFNHALLSIEGLIRKHIHYLHSNEVLKKAFPNNKFLLFINGTKT